MRTMELLAPETLEKFPDLADTPQPLPDKLFDDFEAESHFVVGDYEQRLIFYRKDA